MLAGWILGFSALAAFAAIAGAGALLLLPARQRRRLVPWLVSYAAGTLLGAAFLGMLPAALDRAPAPATMATVLAGIVVFFVLEKLVLWRHCHEADCEVHGQAAPLILIGDAFHNFVDGVVIAAAFLTSVPLGIATAIAVIAHEVPQEVGDFAILLDAGYAKGRALLLNGLSAATILPGALLAWVWLGGVLELVPYVLALSAASFIYIAAADLVPALHRTTGLAASLAQLALLLAGVATIAALRAWPAAHMAGPG